MEKILRDILKGDKFEGVCPKNSKRMSAIKGRGNRTTERRLRMALAKAGVRGWKVQTKGIIGKPDFYFPEDAVAVFVDGCFWHGCPQCGHIPRTRNEYWATKIARNQQRDAEKTSQLRAAGVSVIRFWEHEIQSDLPMCVANIKEAVGAKRRQPQAS